MTESLIPIGKFANERPRTGAAFLYSRRNHMAWIGWTIVIAQIAAVCGYRYFVGKWPLKLDL